jgi:ubiquitin-conjugating enzyme E2 Z
VATTAVAPARSDLREPTDEDEAEAPVYEPFKDLCKRRFLWYYSSYLQTIAEHRTKVAENQPFATMPFESPGNTMEGKYRYTELDARLRAIRAALDRETERWAREGAQLQALESGIAANLQRQFEQTVEAFRRHHDGVALDLELADGNPFVWRLTYFGRPMTNLDGGLFRIRLSFSPRFPDEQPRARVETPLFHHRISDDGVVCYFPQRAEDARAHVEGIIDALEEDDPPYDPRTLVNPTAAKLYWGTPSERKDYNRRLRRAVQRTLE